MNSSWTNIRDLFAAARCSARVVLFCAIIFAARCAPACGPDFPNWLLIGSGDAVLAAPFASFADELARLKLAAPRYRANSATNDGQQTVTAELADLRAALAQSGANSVSVERIVAAHAIEREKVAAFHEVYENWRHAMFGWPPVTNPTPVFSGASLGAGLPAEFADYFRGAVAWISSDTNGARSAWSTLLSRPKQQRRFKSTWAAYMLGRSWEDADRRQAIRFFQQVRALVDEGFPDSAGLAVASIGREARMFYLNREFVHAMELYLEQSAAGDATAMISLRWVAAAALQGGPSALKPLARHPDARRVVTAYLISGGFLDQPADVDGPIGELYAHTMEKVQRITPPPAGWHKFKPAAELWLEAIESADIPDVQEAEKLALLAYQAGEFDQASRWLNRAPFTAATRWLRAKLLLREGKVNEAAALLAAVVRSLASITESNVFVRGELARSLSFASGYAGQSPHDVIPPTDELLGELGALRLARREYPQALDALLRSGFWMDAAYVAERVLTVEELKTYVEHNWPESTPASGATVDEWGDGRVVRERAVAEDGGAPIRHLLARRLVRLDRCAEAGLYFPASVRPIFDSFNTNLLFAADERQPKASRAEALWDAANIMLEHGTVLIGVEGGPYWYLLDVPADEDVETRVKPRSVTVIPPGADEPGRTRSNNSEFEKRLHYRYVAASLAWDAAQLMPNNTDETARVLCIAGSWLKARDPKAADVFYKALVRRCRKTVIGAEADRKRWFPVLDDQGNLQTNKPPTLISVGQ